MVKPTDTILARRPWLAGDGLYAYGFSTAAEGAPASGGLTDEEVGRRLIAAYLRATSDFPPVARHPDMWSDITENFQQEMIGLLRAQDAAGLTAYLRELPRRAGGHGFLQGEMAFQAVVGSPEVQADRALWLMDQLVGMAEAVGVLSLRCPEQVDYESPPALATADALARAVEDETGLPLAMPPVFDGLFALETSVGPVHLRTLMPAYAVWRLSSLIPHLAHKKLADAHVAEIGAGAGFSAWLAGRAGIGRYSLYDLPEVNVVQGYFLMKAMPAGSVELYGEAAASRPWSGGTSSSQRVRARVLPGQAYSQAGQDSFDVTVNIDSFPEIARPISLAYLEHMAEASRMFFSINQEAAAPKTAAEAQGVVRELVAASGWRRALYRQPNWVRPGYVDELWECARP